MKIGIIAAMEVEIEEIRSRLKNIVQTEHTGILFYQGQIDEAEIILLSGGIGKVNAAISTQILIDRFSPELIINTGIAGSLDSQAGHLAIIIADKVTYYDVRKAQMKGTFPFQEWFTCDSTLVKIFQNYSDKNSTLTGKIITGDDFISNPEKKKQLKENYDALCVEMEGAAIAHTAFVNKIPFAMIRCISDLADDASGADYAQHEKEAAQKVAHLLYKAIPEIKKMVI